MKGEENRSSSTSWQRCTGLAHPFWRCPTLHLTSIPPRWPTLDHLCFFDRQRLFSHLCTENIVNKFVEYMTSLHICSIVDIADIMISNVYLTAYRTYTVFSGWQFSTFGGSSWVPPLEDKIRWKWCLLNLSQSSLVSWLLAFYKAMQYVLINVYFEKDWNYIDFLSVCDYSSSLQTQTGSLRKWGHWKSNSL